jgi:hypothetical protein
MTRPGQNTWYRVLVILSGTVALAIPASASADRLGADGSPDPPAVERKGDQSKDCGVDRGHPGWHNVRAHRISCATARGVARRYSISETDANLRGWHCESMLASAFFDKVHCRRQSGSQWVKFWSARPID